MNAKRQCPQFHIAILWRDGRSILAPFIVDSFKLSINTCGPGFCSLSMFYRETTEQVKVQGSNEKNRYAHSPDSLCGARSSFKLWWAWIEMFLLIYVQEMSKSNSVHRQSTQCLVSTPKDGSSRSSINGAWVYGNSRTVWTHSSARDWPVLVWLRSQSSGFNSQDPSWTLIWDHFLISNLFSYAVILYPSLKTEKCRQENKGRQEDGPDPQFNVLTEVYAAEEKNRPLIAAHSTPLWFWNL